jgi:hypothetical protein
MRRRAGWTSDDWRRWDGYEDGTGKRAAFQEGRSEFFRARGRETKWEYDFAAYNEVLKAQKQKYAKRRKKSIIRKR